MKNLLLAGIAAVALASVTTGCVWGRVRVNDAAVADRARNIKVGATKFAEVPQILQADPTMRLPGAKGDLYAYSYSDTKNHGLMLLFVNFDRSTTVTDTLYVEGDRETGLVSSVVIPKKRDIAWRFWPFGED